MGLYDRDYGRYEAEPGVHVTLPQSVTMRIVLATGCVYLLQMLFQQTAWFTGAFELHPLWYKQPWKIYQLLTYGFLHSPHSIQHILFNMYGLWLFGREVEHRYGRKEFLLFYLSAIVFSGLFWNLSALASGGPLLPLVGASGGVVAVAILFALSFPHRTILFLFVFPMPMWVLACILVGFDVYGAIHRSGTSNVAFTAHLAGAAFALFYYKSGWSPGRWIANKLTGVAPRRKPKLRIHEPDQESSDTDQRVDDILKKIQDEGKDSLTRRERRILEKASKEYQRRRQ